MRNIRHHIPFILVESSKWNPYKRGLRQGSRSEIRKPVFTTGKPLTSGYSVRNKLFLFGSPSDSLKTYKMNHQFRITIHRQPMLYLSLSLNGHEQICIDRTVNESAPREVHLSRMCIWPSHDMSKLNSRSQASDTKVWSKLKEISHRQTNGGLVL